MTYTEIEDAEIEKEESKKREDFIRYINDSRWETYDYRYDRKPSPPYNWKG